MASILLVLVNITSGSAQWTNRKPPTRAISAYALHAPEVILGANYRTRVDIWALGRMIFEFLTGRWLFNPRDQTWHIEDPAKIPELMGKNSSEKIIARSRKHDEYLDESGKSLLIDQLFPMTLESAMIKYGLSEAEVAAAAAFIHACLYLNPEQRSSASDLLEHP